MRKRENQTEAAKIICCAALVIFYAGAHAQHTGALARTLDHANIAHLALNIWVLWRMWPRPGRQWLVIPALALGTAGIALTNDAVGVSGAIFALIGLQWDIYRCGRNWLFIAISLTLALAIPQIAFLPHAVPFLAGLVYAQAVRAIYQNFKSHGIQ